MVYKEGEFKGYLSISIDGRTGRVRELYRKDNSISLTEICHLCIDCCEVETLEFVFSIPEMKGLKDLQNLCETYEIACNHSFHIFDFEAVIRAYLNLLEKTEGIVDGETSFYIEDELYRICVKGGCQTVKKERVPREDQLKNLPAYTCKEAMQLLLSPLSALQVEEKSNEIRKWFPLPLYLSILDAC